MRINIILLLLPCFLAILFRLCNLSYMYKLKICCILKKIVISLRIDVISTWTSHLLSRVKKNSFYYISQLIKRIFPPELFTAYMHVCHCRHVVFFKWRFYYKWKLISSWHIRSIFFFASLYFFSIVKNFPFLNVPASITWFSIF